MTDLTPIFDGLLTEHQARPTQRSFSVDNLDGFLKDAYKIHHAITSLHRDLRDIRQAYLSTAPPRRALIRSARNDRQPRSLTDRDREEIDASSNVMLRQLNAKVRQLYEAEQKRRNDEAALIAKKFSGRLGALGSWAAGGSVIKKTAEHMEAEEKFKFVSTHRKSVLLMIQECLKECVKTRQDMVEVRIKRETEKSQSVLATAQGAQVRNLGLAPEPASPGREKRKPSQTLPPEERPPYNPTEDLSPEQIQMFEKQNNDMLDYQDKQMDQLRTAEKSLVEISEMQTQLIQHLATQSAQIEQLVTDSANTAENVARGKRELAKATQRSSPAKYTFYATCGLCTFLVVWDLLI